MSLRPRGGRLAYERGIRYSSLPAPARHLALTLATWADIETGVIPDRFQPAQSTLEQATGLSRGSVFKHLNTLEAEGWIGREVGGGRNRRSRYWLLIPIGAKTSRKVTGNGNQSPDDWNLGNQSSGEPETSHLVDENQSPDDYKSPSSPFQSPPPASPDPSATAPGGGGGSGLEQAAAFLEELPGEWAAGPDAARRLSPLLLERAHSQGWDLDQALALELTKNPRGITSYEAVLPGRIRNLRKRASQHRAGRGPAARALPDWCESEDCNEVTRNRTEDGPDGYPVSRPCRSCHPDMIKDAA